MTFYDRWLGQMSVYSGHRQVISFRSALMLAAFMLLGYLALMVLFRNDQALRTVICDLLCPVFNGLATVGLIYAAQRTKIYGWRIHLAWTILAAAQLSFTLGDIAWTVLEIGFHEDPSSYVADGLYLLFYPLFAAGILLLPAKPLNRDELLKLLLDIGIIMSSTVLVFWAFLIEPLIAANEEDALAFAIALAYPAMDLILFFGLLQLLFRRLRSPGQGPLLLLSAGIIAGILADVVYLLQSLQGTYESGNLLDMGWLMSYAFIGLGGVLQANASKLNPSKSTDQFEPKSEQFAWLSYLPYFFAAGSYLLLIWSRYHLSDSFGEISWGVGGIIGLVILRQVLGLNENARLYKIAKKEIDERERSQELLSQSEERYRTVFEVAPEVIFTISSKDATLTSLNPAFEKLTGWPARERLGKPFIGIMHPEDLPIAQEMFSETLSGEYAHSHELRVLSQSGEYLTAEIICVPQIERGKIVGKLGFARNITERKQAEITLQVAKEYAENLIQTANAIVIGLDLHGNITVFNQAAEKITGYSKAELQNHNWFELIVPKDRYPEVWSVFKYFKSADLPRNFENPILTKSGQERYIVWQNSLVREQDRIVGIVSFGIDITDRKLAEDALQKSERSYRLLAENVTDVIWTMDLDLKFTYLSPSIARLIGYGVEEATLLTLEKILTPSSLRMVQKVIAEELENENNPQKDPLRSRTLEVEEYCKDGRIIWVEVKTSFLRDQNGRAIGMQGISRDITDRKIAENALIESEAKYRTIFENTGNAALILDEDTTISHANEVADEIFGYRGEDVVGKKSWTEFIYKDDLKFMKKYHDLRRSDPKAVPQSYELRLIDAHGKMRCAFITVAMIPGTKQSVASLTDITERKAAEEMLKASLQEKEILLKEVHHRVKNNLQVVSSLLSLQSECIKDKQTVEMFRESQNRIKSMALIHEKLYRSKDISKINFSEYIRSLSGNLVRSYETVSGVRLNLNVEDIYLGIDSAIPCGLIINELVSNSLKHAFPAGSKSSEGEIKIEFLRDDNNKFKLTVSDNGIGFPRDVDFQQTESLGLQLVRILTDQLSGSIELHRSSGTKFIITFTENKT